MSARLPISFFAYLFAVLVSHIGFFMQVVAEGWLVAELSPEPMWAGVVGFCAGAPMLLFSMAGGGLADRFDRRLIIISCQTGAMIVALVLAAITRFGVVEIWHVALLAFFTGLTSALHGPAYHGFLYDLVGSEGMTRAVSLNATQLHLSRLLGPAFAGVLIGVIQPWGCFLVNGLSFLVVIPVVALLRSPAGATKTKASTEPFFQQLTAAIAYVRTSESIRSALLILGLSTILVMPHMTLLPLFVKEYLLLGADVLGWLMAISAFGSILTTLLVGKFHKSFETKGPVVVAIGGSIAGLSLLGLANFKQFELITLFVFAIGISLSFVVVSSQIIVQRDVTNTFRGRVLGMWMTLFQGMFPVGSLLVGLWAQWTDIRVAWFIAGGSLLLFLGVFSILSLLKPVRSN